MKEALIQSNVEAPKKEIVAAEATVEEISTPEELNKLVAETKADISQKTESFSQNYPPEKIDKKISELGIDPATIATERNALDLELAKIQQKVIEAGEKAKLEIDAVEGTKEMAVNGKEKAMEKMLASMNANEKGYLESKSFEIDTKKAEIKSQLDNLDKNKGKEFRDRIEKIIAKLENRYNDPGSGLESVKKQVENYVNEKMPNGLKLTEQLSNDVENLKNIKFNPESSKLISLNRQKNT